MMIENYKISVHGNVKIYDGEKLIQDKDNAVHPKNMAIALARGLSNSAKFNIFKIKFGNQGSYVDSSGTIIYRPPNVIESSADLYNPTYVEVVDSSNVLVGSGNSVAYTTIPGSTSTRVIITSVISASEAANLASDSGGGSGSSESTYFFDEIGLFTQGTGSPDLLNESEELMLSHLIMSPVEHTGNRDLTVVYTLKITVS